MNSADIIRTARQVRDGGHWNQLDLINFALLIAATEREACARWCDIVAREVDDINGLAGYCAKGIRARNGIQARGEK